MATNGIQGNLLNVIKSVLGGRTLHPNREHAVEQKEGHQRRTIRCHNKSHTVQYIHDRRSSPGWGEMPHLRR